MRRNFVVRFDDSSSNFSFGCTRETHNTDVDIVARKYHAYLADDAFFIQLANQDSRMFCRYFDSDAVDARDQDAAAASATAFDDIGGAVSMGEGDNHRVFVDIKEFDFSKTIGDAPFTCDLEALFDIFIVLLQSHSTSQQSSVGAVPDTSFGKGAVQGELHLGKGLPAMAALREPVWQLLPYGWNWARS